MAIDTRARGMEFAAFGLLAIAIGGGWYSVADGVGNLEFVEVGWWNIRDLSDASRDDQEIADIAAAIRGIDVLAVGEVNDTVALEQIAEELGTSWEWAATPNKIGRTTGSREFYGFLWDSDVAQMVGSVHVDPDPGDNVDREPAWATFRTVDGTLDFTVIAVHITFGRTVGPRRAEVRQMDDVWNRTQAATPDDDDLILVGDFNRNTNDVSFDQILAIPGMVRANQDTGPTHVSSNSTYDQIFISLNETTEWTGEDVFHFDEAFFGNDDAAAQLALSDHRPVWITLVIPEQDDD